MKTIKEVVTEKLDKFLNIEVYVKNKGVFETESFINELLCRLREVREFEACLNKSRHRDVSSLTVSLVNKDDSFII